MGLAFEMALVAVEHTDEIINPTRDAVAKRLSSVPKPVSATRIVYATRLYRLCGQASERLSATPIRFRLLPDPTVDKLEPKRAP